MNASIVVESHDLENNVKVRKGVRLHENVARGTLEIDSPGVPIDRSVSQHFSPSGKFSMYSCKTGDTFRIDVFGLGGAVCSILNAPAEPISDPNLQYVAWTRCEKGFVFVGEKQTRPSAHPWVASKPSASSLDLENISAKSSWETKDSWGECFTNNSCFTLYYVDIESGTVSDLICDDFSFSTSSVSPVVIEVVDGESILFTGVDHAPRRLGIVYCRNRPSKTFVVSVGQPKQTPKEVLSVSNFRGMFNVRAFEGNVAFFSQAREGSLTIEDNFPHNCAASLHVSSIQALLDMNTDPCTFYEKTLVVPVVAHTPVCPDTDFHGFYPSTGNDLWWVMDGSRLLVNSVSRSATKIFEVDLATKCVSPLDCCHATQAGQWSVLDVRGNVVLAHYSDLLSGSAVHSVPLLGGKSRAVCAIGSSFPFEDISADFAVDVVRVPHAHDSEAIYTYKKDDKKRPTLVIVHGGPHSTDTNGFIPAQMLYLLEGWNLFSINYGGSLGFGHHRIQELMGCVGTNDVLDCIACMDAMEGRWDSSKLVVYGGSHGGFLSGHLTGRYPNLFKAAIIRNPVINMASSHFETDIPDWNLAVCGVSEASLDIQKMYSMSPIVHANQVTAATLLGIGMGDCRVSPMQGRAWYHALKSAPGKPLVRMLEYPENNHALDGVHAYADFAIRGVHFANDAVCERH